MKPVEIEIKIRLAQREADYWREILAKKSCRDCKYNYPLGSCKLAGGVSPPPEVQAVGCSEWMWDSIPF